MKVEEEFKKVSRQYKRAIYGVVIFDGVVMFGFLFWYFLNYKNELAQAGDVATVITMVGMLTLAPMLIFIVQYGGKLARLRDTFWKEIATTYGYTYVFKLPFEKDALLFQEGDLKGTGHGLLGKIGDRPFRFFEYSFTTVNTAAKREREVYDRSVFEVTFSGTFPHLYLNNTHNQNLSKNKEFSLPRVSLPGDLEKKFSLYVPQQYEIEALEVFTPDVLEYIAQSNWQHDVELINQKLYIFRERSVSTEQELVDEIKNIQGLLALIGPKLNRMQLASIGNLPPTLSTEKDG